MSWIFRRGSADGTKAADAVSTLRALLTWPPVVPAELVELLRAVERDGEDALPVLALLGTHPRLVLALDDAVRSDEHQRAVRRTGLDGAGPAGLVLAAAARSGWVREEAVHRMLADPRPEYTPFLVVRSADWVRQVRDTARAGLALLLHEDPDRHLPQAAALVSVLGERGRADFALTQVTAAARRSPRLLWARGVAPRIAYDAVEPELSVEELVEVALSQPQRHLRGRAAERAAREVLWNTRTRHLTRLAAAPHAEVRATALTGLARAGVPVGPDHLDDRNALVRALARAAFTKAGGDPRAHYRDALPALGAIDGLGEVGSAADADLLTPLLDHPAARVRVAALRALRRLDAVPARTAALLRDPSARVVREAAAALRARGAVPAGELWALMADDRVVVRRAGYWLLRGGGPEIRRQAALRLVDDPDPELARLAGNDLRRDRGHPL